MDDSDRLDALQENIIRLADGSFSDSVQTNNYTIEGQLATYHHILRESVELQEAEATLYIYQYLRQKVKPTLETYQIMERLHHCTNTRRLQCLSNLIDTGYL